MKRASAPPENGAARSIVPPTPRAGLNENTNANNSLETESGPDDPLPWLVNLAPDEYESLRRGLAREHGWRVAFLDRLYQQARRKAGLR